VVTHKYQAKKQNLIKKFEKLCETNERSVKKTYFKSVEPIGDFVRNLSSVVFSDNEMHLLNRGFKFAFQQHEQTTLENTLISFETAIRHLEDEEKIQIRSEMLNEKENIKCQKMTNQMKDIWKTIKGLREKRDAVYFMKADKSNNIVIMDKEEYVKMIEDFIESGPYEEVRRSPLPGMIRRTREAVKTASETLGREIIWKLNVSNPSIPRLYTQLKLHKPGRKVRPITSNNNSPNEKLAQWLLSQFEAMPIKFETVAIKNTIEFVEKTKDLVLLEGEMQVSFDVESLYPNIPIGVTLQLLEQWLQSNQLEYEVVRELVRLTKICMDENWFRFNDKYYRQNFGCSMGSSLSPFLANLFMSHFETTLKKEGIFPRVWLRYVDDVYAIIKNNN
ncbi:uncharacterized protein LOC129572066, partial [Sitodiplosis mosellana]|uniref:uncharacterized protein LOC129572066 n=1 Tax=Sitodiplosis mosellana TaxID=263140 RepID=UPI0024438570